MTCLVCGSRTSVGASLCSRCFKRMDDPLRLAANALDPMADQRFVMTSSIALRIGPSFSGEVRLGKGLDPSLTFERMLASEDRTHIPSFIDKYLDDLGVGLELTGSEMIPDRKLIFEMVRASADLSFDTDTWAKACLRLGNVTALAIRSVARMPLEPADSARALSDLRERSEYLYSMSQKWPELVQMAERNRALMMGWARQEAGP